MLDHADHDQQQGNQTNHDEHPFEGLYRLFIHKKCSQNQKSSGWLEPINPGLTVQLLSELGSLKMG